jgi:hypothetical protein
MKKGARDAPFLDIEPQLKKVEKRDAELNNEKP